MLSSSFTRPGTECSAIKQRIRHPDAGVLSKEELELQDASDIKKRMFMYILSEETRENFQKLKEDVQENPKTLFIIIADECHWGITRDKDDKSSAHNLFINEWCKENSPKNVLVVQISATPFNLLTQNSRLPVVPCVLLNDKVSTTQRNCEEGDLVVLDREPNLPEHVTRNSKEVELHVVHWSEVELKNFEGGMQMKLKTTLNLPDACYQYLQISDGKLGVTSNESEATDFIVQGSHGIVTIKGGHERGKLLTITAEEHGNLRAKVDPSQPTTFEVKLDFGIGVVAFSSCENPNHYIAVNEHGHVTLQAAKVERKCGVCIINPIERGLARVSFQFYIDQSGPVEVGTAGKTYLSLNYYLSTINYSDINDQKIREDTFFQKVVDQAKRQNKILSKSEKAKQDKLKDSSLFPVDALLCAEYCYHILHVGVYSSDEIIRQALNPDADDCPAANFERTLNLFTRELAKEAATPRKYIHPDAFELVRRELCDEVKYDFKESLKQVKRSLQKDTSEKELQEHTDELDTSFVACLMHLSQLEFQKLKENTRPISIVEAIEQRLQKNGCQAMIEKWNHVVQEFETSSLTKNLIESGKGKSGKMKIVRAKSMETADQFFYTLRLARTKSSLDKCFDVIKDYGGIQIEKQLMKSSSPFFRQLQPENCTFEFPPCPCPGLKLQPKRKKCVSCQHVHKVITQYEDLENLACVLILVDKGRMGDTFPQSFDCLDLRLSYDKSREFKEVTPLFLSTLIQELGRMCRYARVPVSTNHVQTIPYVLIGRQLYKELERSVEMTPSISAISCTRADRYMTKSGKHKGAPSSSLRWSDYEAHKDSYDHQNDLMHNNRILLQAEPQIGKTGTYLCLIRDLRQEILGKEVSSISASAVDEGTFYCYSDYDLHETSIASVQPEKQDWEFPYWKAIQHSLNLNEKPVLPGKYSIGGCFYTHETEENPYVLMQRQAQGPTRSAHHYAKTNCKEEVLRAWPWYHFQNCVECGRLLQGKESVLVEDFQISIDGTPVIVTCSLPSSRPAYNHLVRRIRSLQSAKDLTEALPSPPILPYWIFHPSHRGDPRKCTLNYHHVMQERGKIVSYVQAVVVRKEKFEAYRSTWGKVLAIFQLPESLPNCELGPSEGGIGYARLFIQKMASALSLEYIFVIDDNVAVMSKAVLTTDNPNTSDETVARDSNGVMKMERCSFYQPLTHLQKIAEGKDTPPRSLEPYPFKDPMDAQTFPLYSYSGPAKLFGDKQHESYGVLGLLRSIPRALNPFTKTQVYAVILLNVKSTVEKGVFYRPWPCWEDLRFNDDCDKEGLWVVKCNRYRFLKVQYNDWINDLVLPNIFQWKDDSILEEMRHSTELPEDLEERIILEHLRNFVSNQDPEKCFKGCIGYDQQDEAKDSVFPPRIVQEVEANEGTEEVLANGTPVLIISYCVTNSERKSINLLDSTFCNTKEKIIFITSAKEAVEEWPQMTLATIPTKKGICFLSEMRDRNAKFSIYSAADPRKHSLRYILIEASFSQEFTREGASSSVKDENETENNQATLDRNKPNTEESIPSHCVQHKTKGVKRLLEEALDGHVETKRVKIKDESSQNEVLIPKTGGDEVGYAPKTKFVKESHVTGPKTVGEGMSINSIKGREDNCETSQAARDIHGPNKVKQMKTESAQDKQEYNNGERNILKKGGPPSVTHRKTEMTKENSKNSSKAAASEVRNMLGPDHERKKDSQKKKVKIKTKCSSVATALHEGGASKNMDANNNVLSAKADEDDDDDVDVRDVDDGSIIRTVSDNQEPPSKKSKKKDLNISQHMEGTNAVTKIIVDLWGEYKEILSYSKEQIEQRGNSDLTTDEVQKKLQHFTSDQLQEPDEKGYTALLKACSLPSMSPHVIQYLITTRRVDLNCQLPPQFDTSHAVAKKLVPEMFALSVAVRSRNVKLVPTFMTRPGAINVRSKDSDGNTALHHCVLSKSKISFQKLFPLYKPLEWKEMRNNEGKNPLDICIAETGLKGGDEEKEKSLKTLLYMRQEMEEASH